MDNEQFRKMAAVFSGSYIKRWLEPRYDQLPGLEELRRLHPMAKYGIEAVLYAVSAYANVKFQPQSVLGLTAKELLSDAAPEICSRLLNDVRGDLSAARTMDPDPQVQSIATKMLSLDNADLLALLVMLESADAAALQQFRSFAAIASPEELAKLAKVPAEQRQSLLDLQSPPGWQWGKSLKNFVASAWEVTRNCAKKGYQFTQPILASYIGGFVWLIKLCAVLWGWAFVIWFLYALLADQTGLSVALGSLAAICGLLAGWGRLRQMSWLFVAGLISGLMMLILMALAIVGRADAVPGLSFLFFIGLPTLAIVILAAPLTTMAEALRAIVLPMYELVANVLRMVIVVFFGILLFTALLLVFPVRGNPVAIFLIGPLAIVAIFSAGTRLIRISPERFFGWPLRLGLIILLLVSLIALSMPDLISSVGNLPRALNERMVAAPVPVSFASSRAIDFVDVKRGSAKIWYAQREEGGFDLFYCPPSGGYTPDGRKLVLADTPAVQNMIAAWVDTNAARKPLPLSNETPETTAARVALAQKYVNGELAPASLEDAAAWFRIAAEAGNPKAMSYLGELYQSGRGVPQDYSKAVRWYQRAVEGGSPEGACNLAILYINGWGVPKDAQQAMPLLRQAATAGNKEAMFNLAQLYQTGIAGKPDLQGADEWYRKAAALGYPGAEERHRALQTALLGQTQQQSDVQNAVDEIARKYKQREPQTRPAVE